MRTLRWKMSCKSKKVRIAVWKHVDSEREYIWNIYILQLRKSNSRTNQ